MAVVKNDGIAIWKIIEMYYQGATKDSLIHWVRREYGMKPTDARSVVDKALYNEHMEEIKREKRKLSGGVAL